MTSSALHRRSAGASVPDTPTTRLLAGLLAGALLTAVALPARHFAAEGEVRDSFPFSHYPMFSARRSAHYRVAHLLGIDADGTSRPLHYSYLGTGGLNAVRRQVRRRVRDGDGQLLAEHAAALLAVRDRAEDRGILEVRMVRGRYHLESYLRGSDGEDFTQKIELVGAAPVPGRRSRAAAVVETGRTAAGR
ncbi:hypothetical protein ACFU1Q_07530 [Brachybacterium paraconglomeratum]